LTADQSFDIVLMVALDPAPFERLRPCRPLSVSLKRCGVDKISQKNKMERLSLKNVRIRDKNEARGYFGHDIKNGS